MAPCCPGIHDPSSPVPASFPVWATPNHSSASPLHVFARAMPENTPLFPGHFYLFFKNLSWTIISSRDKNKRLLSLTVGPALCSVLSVNYPRSVLTTALGTGYSHPHYTDGDTEAQIGFHELPQSERALAGSGPGPCGRGSARLRPAASPPLLGKPAPPQEHLLLRPPAAARFGITNYAVTRGEIKCRPNSFPRPFNAK